MVQRQVACQNRVPAVSVVPMFHLRFFPSLFQIRFTVDVNKYARTVSYVQRSEHRSLQISIHHPFKTRIMRSSFLFQLAPLAELVFGQVGGGLDWTV